ncbi:MAG: hypothetical protein E7415_06685 [Ruminococcaceae bacterium]|nr:hypothetical protein [Oscillospiraceae bacterium]
MSDNFYDFDKDEEFLESYTNDNTSSSNEQTVSKDFSSSPSFEMAGDLSSDGNMPNHHPKEFEIEIPIPQPRIKSTIPSKEQISPVSDNKKTAPQRAEAKKLSSTAKSLSVIGIIVSCAVAFAISFVGMYYLGDYLPLNKKEDNKPESSISDIEKSTDTVEIQGEQVIKYENNDETDNRAETPMFSGSSDNSGASSDSDNESSSEENSDSENSDDDNDTANDDEENNDSLDEDSDSSDEIMILD